MTKPSQDLKPSLSLVDQQVQLLVRYTPFAQMRREDVLCLMRDAHEAYYAPGEAAYASGAEAPDHISIIKQGYVNASAQEVSSTAFHYEPGQMFPLGAALSGTPVHVCYRAVTDVFCWNVPVGLLLEVAARSVPLAEALTQESRLLLQLSRKALQTALASEVFSHFSMERPLSELGSKSPLTCLSGDSLATALSAMQTRKVGSILVCDAHGRCEGIFTLKDVIGKVVMAGTRLDTPMSKVMSTPVHALSVTDTVEDAALLMARYGVRHVPVLSSLQDARVVNIISERDLYALQRLSLNQVSTAARSAADIPQMQLVARDIRILARNLVSQGVQAKSLTRLISHLNDVLTERLVHLMLERHGLSATQMCWLSFGSEGRTEQTIATDQDNGLVYSGEFGKQRWVDFARDVNQALDACGYPLCKGNIMASNPQCCLTLAEWQTRFDHWIEQGSPEDLLRANIFFDLRPLAGRKELGGALTKYIDDKAQTVPRFLHLLAQDMLSRSVPLNWLGNLETSTHDGHQIMDIKLQGTAVFVDAARLRALAMGVFSRNTRERFEQCALRSGKDMKIAQDRADAFEFLQMLRLRVQMAQLDVEAGGSGVAGWVSGLPNAVDVDQLGDIDRKLLKMAMRSARELQQEMRMDFGG
ncbi:MAG: hypothetical protein RLZZ271_11 [Pseudomonadota bacterium]|jgi:CBS domain-containing protein